MATAVRQNVKLLRSEKKEQVDGAPVSSSAGGMSIAFVLLALGFGWSRVATCLVEIAGGPYGLCPFNHEQAPKPT